MYQPPAEPVPTMVSIFGPWGWVTSASAASPVPTSSTVDGRISYVPLVTRSTCVVRRVWWGNGATTAGATIEVGIYGNSGYAPSARLVSGSAAQGTTNEVQFADVTDTVLPPGLYWIAVATSTTTNTTLFRISLPSNLDAATRYEETGTTLPSTATPVETTVNQSAWLIGFATTASP